MTELSDLLIRNLSSVFNQRDLRKRRRAIKELWSADGVLWSAEGTYIGYKAIEEAAASLLARYPEYDFSFIEEPNEIPGAARMRWSFGAPNTPPAITGMDMVVAEDGRIAMIYRFLDGADM